MAGRGWPKGKPRGKMSKERKESISKKLKGRNISEETRKKISLAKKGKSRPDLAERNSQRKGEKRGPRTEETKAKISAAIKGKPRPWVSEWNRKRKGIPHGPHTEETKEKIRSALKGKPKTEAHKKAMRVPKTITPAFRKAQSDRQKNHNMMWTPGASEKLSKYKTDWWKGLSQEEMEEIRKKMTEGRHKWWSSLSPEERLSYLESRNYSPSKPEKKLMKILQPNVRYTGDGSFWVFWKDGRHKNPDFLVDNQRKVIEVLGGRGFFHFEDEEREYIQRYKEIGFDCLIIWEDELADRKSIQRKIQTFL